MMFQFRRPKSASTVLPLFLLTILTFAGFAIDQAFCDDVEKTISGRVVDESGVPVANVVVHCRLIPPIGKFTEPMITDEQGRFRGARASLPNWAAASTATSIGLSHIVFAKNDQRERFGMQLDDISDFETDEDLDRYFNELVVVVRKPQLAKVRVVDVKGHPVAGAQILARPVIFHQPTTVTTDEQGNAILPIIGALPLEEIFAYKSGVGFDYQSFNIVGRPYNFFDHVRREFPSEGIELVLEGANPVTVAVIDEMGRPVEGAEVRAQGTMQKGNAEPSEAVRMTLREEGVLTDQHGFAIFDWIPKWNADPLDFWVNDKLFESRLVRYLPGEKKEPQSDGARRGSLTEADVTIEVKRVTPGPIPIKERDRE